MLATLVAPDTFCLSEANSIIKAVTELRAEGYGIAEKQTSNLVIWGNVRSLV